MTNRSQPETKGTPDQTTPRLLTTVAAATRLNVDPSTVRRWIEDGRLPAVKPGRDYRIDPGDLDALLAVSSVSKPLTLAPGGAR